MRKLRKENPHPRQKNPKFCNMVNLFSMFMVALLLMLSLRVAFAESASCTIGDACSLSSECLPTPHTTKCPPGTTYDLFSGTATFSPNPVPLCCIIKACESWPGWQKPPIPITFTYSWACKPNAATPMPISSNPSPTNDICKGLTTVKSSALTGKQVVINEKFAEHMRGLVNCAKSQGAKLHVVSTSRCRKPGNNTLAVDKSDHALGMATDSQLSINGNLISRENMNRAWCAFNAHVKNPCKDKYGTHMPPQSDLNKSIYKFLECAINNSLSAGVTYKGKNSDGTFKQDGNHFQRGHYSEAAKQAYQKLLKKFCKSQCPKVPKGHAGQYACDCAGY